MLPAVCYAAVGRKNVVKQGRPGEEPMLSLVTRTLSIALLAALAGPLAPLPAQGQAPYPSQTIKVMVPNPAGGLPDTVARIVGRRLQERLGQSVVIENRPGANGRVAVAALLGAPADGYTLLVTDGSILTINPLLYANLAYVPKDILPIAMLARAPMFLAVNPKMPATNLSEFIAHAKAHPGQINYGSGGIGSTHHLSMEAMAAALKLDMKHVPFKGTGEAVPALLGGHIDVLFSAYPSLAGAAEGGQVRLLASNGLQRSAQAPNLPALSEVIPGFDLAPTIGIFGRADTDPAAVDKLVAEALATLKDTEMVGQLAVVGVEAAGAAPDGYAAALEAETQRMTAAVEAAGLKAK
jgi:tripartite-type tricarboxylate transporter receptor subunit TctC